MTRRPDPPFIVVRNRPGHNQDYWTGYIWPETGLPAWTGNLARIQFGGRFWTREAAAARLAQIAAFPMAHVAIIHIDERDLPSGENEQGEAWLREWEALVGLPVGGGSGAG